MMPNSAKVSAQRIDQHGALTDQKVAHLVQHLYRLLLGGLNGNKTHRRPGRRFCDRLGVGGIRLSALHVWLHIGWRHRSNRVPQLGELSRPVMRGAAGFHTDKTGRQSGENPQDIASAQLLAQHHIARSINAVKLEDVLRKAQTDRGNLLHGRLR
jgi:hypothetical protein